MVDVTQAMETQYVNTDMVQNAEKKKLVVIGAGEYESTDFGVKLTLPVEIDGKQKQWRPNRDSVTNLARVWGKDSKDWSGKVCDLKIITVMGKDSIIATPQDRTVAMETL